METAIGMDSAEWPADTITGTGAAPRGWNPLSGAFRTRLRIDFKDGTTALFVVDNAELRR